MTQPNPLSSLDALRPSTYKNLLYLLLGFPLGLLYGVTLLGGTLIGAVLALTVMGTGLLAGSVHNVWRYADWERYLAGRLTGVLIESPQYPKQEKFRSLLEQAIFWKSLVYLLLKPLLGFAVTGATLAVWLPSLVLLGAPLLKNTPFGSNTDQGPPLLFAVLVGLLLVLIASRLTNLAAPRVAALAAFALTDQQTEQSSQQNRLEALALAAKAANLASSIDGSNTFERLLKNVLSSATQAAGASAGALLLETRQVLVGFSTEALQGLLSEGALENSSSQYRRSPIEQGFMLTPKSSSYWKTLVLLELSSRRAQLVVYFDQTTPKRAELEFLRTVANQLDVALENARLIALAQNQAALEERHKLARELHDSVSQALYGISLGAKTAKAQLERDPQKAKEALEYIEQLTEAGVIEMRALIFELRPESLEQDGLVAALQKQAEMMRLRYRLEMDTQFTEPQLSLEAKQALLRIAQEALHNTVKHAQAKRARLELTANSLLISDDGIGFDPSQRFDDKLGQRTMRERAEAIGASFALSSSNQGTQIRVQW